MLVDRLSRFAKGVDPDSEEWEKIVAIANTMNPLLRKAFLAVVKYLRGELDAPAVRKWIESRSPERAADEIVQGIEGGFDGLRRAMSEAIIETVPKVEPGTIARVVLDPGSPRFQTIVNDSVLGPIREISITTRDAIAQQIENGLRNGQNPEVVARELRQLIGLTTQQQAHVDSYRQLLTMNSSDALNRALRDQRFDRTITNAIESGKGLSQANIDKYTARYAQRWLNYRASTIARTESMNVTRAAQRAYWQQAIEDGKVIESDLIRFWHVAHDERTCPICEPIPKMNAEGVDFNGMFDTPIGPVLGPGMHPDCRCVVFTKFKIKPIPR